MYGDPEAPNEPFFLVACDPLCLRPLERGVGDLVYRGGVIYVEPGVAGADDGLRPNKALWDGLKGMSDKSSLPVAKGEMALTMFTTNKRRSSSKR